ncbi:MAG TPA: uL4 family ribosomal protein, partial [Gemmatimonadaceae bacterium]
RPRKYTEIVPKQVRALARKSAFNARAREGALFVIDAFNYEAPKTSRLQQLLARLEVAHRKVLILTDGVKPNVFLSGRNLPLAHVMPFSDVSTYHILWSDVVLVESGAFGEAMAPVKEKELAKVKVVRYVNRTKDDGRSKMEDGEPETGSAPKSKAKKKSAVKAKAAARKAPAKKTAAKKPAAKAAAKKAPAKKAAPKKKGK